MDADLREQLAQVMASVVARVALEDPSIAKVAGSGLRDSTLAATGDPQQVTSDVLPAIEAALRELRELQALLAAGDEAAVWQWLAKAKSNCKKLGL